MIPFHIGVIEGIHVKIIIEGFLLYGSIEIGWFQGV